MVKATLQNNYIRASRCPLLCRNWLTNIHVWRSGMQEDNKLKVSRYAPTLLQPVTTEYPYNNGYTVCLIEVVVSIIRIIQRIWLYPRSNEVVSARCRVGWVIDFSFFLSVHLSIRGRNIFRWGFVHLSQHLSYPSLFSWCPSISLRAEPCPVCIFHFSCLIRFIYIFHQPRYRGAYADFSWTIDFNTNVTHPHVLGIYA